MESASSSPTASMQSLSIGDCPKNEKFKIALDNPTNTYYSGQTIRGSITLQCKQSKKIRGIYFRIIGYGKCAWTDLLRRESINVEGKTDRPAIKYSGSENYLNSVVYIIGSKNGPAFNLSEGTTTYDFSFTLKPKLPSSFAGTNGKIKYKMEFTIDKPWKFDEKQTIVVNVIQEVSLDSIPNALQPVEQHLTRTIGYISSGPVSLHVYVPKSAFVIGEKLPIQAIVSNNSHIHVDKVKFILNKIIDYRSTVPMVAIKREVQRIVKKEAGGVSKKTEQRYEHVLDVPLIMPSQNDEVSQLIHIKYEIKVEAKISGLYKNLVVVIPTTIGNVPVSSTQPVAIPYPSNAAVDSHPRRSIGFNFNRLSMTSNASFRLIPSASASASPNSTHSHDHSTSDIDSLSSNSLMSSYSTQPDDLSSSQTSSISSATADLSSRSGPGFIQPSAPPLDLSATNTSFSLPNTSGTRDAPPSYEEVFGSASSSRSEVHSSSFHVTASKT